MGSKLLESSLESSLDPNRIAANPAYSLIRIAEMSTGERDALVELGADLTDREGGIDGVLVAATGSGLPDKVVDCAGVAMFRSLASGRCDQVAGDGMFRLLYDEIITIESGAGPVTGAAAFEQLESTNQPDRPSGALSTMSYRALDTVARLRLPSREQICTRLYWFNRVPLSARWQRAIPGESVVRRWLGDTIASGHQHERSNPSNLWVQAASVENAGGWLSFVRHDDRRELPSREFGYKLYLSPRPGQLHLVLPLAVAATNETVTSRFKVGADAAGLLRPDKIVFYLADASEVTALADRLATALVGIDAQGVPFSAAMTSDGLLSWGGDPTEDESPIGGGRESWRLSVCRRLAESMFAAQRAGVAPATAVSFAARRLELDGVDIASFAPTHLISPTPVTSIKEQAA
ncbi:MAG: hypothetical protein ABIR32_06250 [Ilumatobacteraceae bacterium]